MFVFNLFISIAGSKGKNEAAKISSFQSIERNQGSNETVT